MAQNDFSVENQGFPSFRADLNDALQSLATNSSGATGPSTTYPYQWWYDTANDTLKIRNSANDGWIDFANFDTARDTFAIDRAEGTAKVWLNGTESAAVDASHNVGVSGGTDSGVGDYTYSFTNAFASSQYAYTTEVDNTQTDRFSTANGLTSSTIRINVHDVSASGFGDAANAVIIHGDLA